MVDKFKFPVNVTTCYNNFYIVSLRKKCFFFSYLFTNYQRKSIVGRYLVSCNRCGVSTFNDDNDENRI